MKEEVVKKEVIVKKYGGGGDMVYWLGIIGSALYFVNGASSFKEVVVGLLKSLVWPAFLVHKLFEVFKF